MICGAEIHVELGPHYPSQKVSVQIREKKPIGVPGTSIRSVPTTGEGITHAHTGWAISMKGRIVIQFFLE